MLCVNFYIHGLKYTLRRLHFNFVIRTHKYVLKHSLEAWQHNYSNETFNCNPEFGINKFHFLNMFTMHENNCLDFPFTKNNFHEKIMIDLLLQSVLRYLMLCSFFVIGSFFRFMFMCLFMVRNYHQFFSL